MPRRLRPTAEIHPDAILVGDPGRAMALAQVLTEAPKMANHARGLWGYSGMRADGRGLTVQATGMGGPSAALVLRDLAELGVRQAVRIGTCAGLWEGFEPGNLVIVEGARAWAVDGRGAGPPVSPDAGLTRRLREELGESARLGVVASLDALHPSPGHSMPSGDVADMQTAALFAAADELSVAIAAILVVTDGLDARPLGDESLAERVSDAGRAAIAAIGPDGSLVES